MGGGERRRVEAQRLQAAWRIAEHDHIGAGDQVKRRGQAGGRVEVQRGDLLTAVEDLVAGMVGHPVAARRLDLDHLGLEVAKEHRRHRTGDPLAEVGDTQAMVSGQTRRLPCARRRGSRVSPFAP